MLKPIWQCGPGHGSQLHKGRASCWMEAEPQVPGTLSLPRAYPCPAQFPPNVLSRNHWPAPSELSQGDVGARPCCPQDGTPGVSQSHFHPTPPGSSCPELSRTRDAQAGGSTSSCLGARLWLPDSGRLAWGPADPVSQLCMCVVEDTALG
jgi:hypothetical protein